MSELKRYRWNTDAVAKMSRFVKLLWKAQVLDAKRFREAEFHLVNMKNDAMVVDVMSQLSDLKGDTNWYTDGGKGKKS